VTPEAAQAEAGEREDEELAPNVPTDAEIEAGAIPLDADEDADDEALADEDADDEALADEDDEAEEEAPAAEGEVDAEAGEDAEDEDGDGGSKATRRKR
jgi:hypothetical protein